MATLKQAMPELQVIGAIENKPAEPPKAEEPKPEEKKEEPKAEKRRPASVVPHTDGVLSRAFRARVTFSRMSLGFLGPDEGCRVGVVVSDVLFDGLDQ